MTAVPVKEKLLVVFVYALVSLMFFFYFSPNTKSRIFADMPYSMKVNGD